MVLLTKVLLIILPLLLLSGCFNGDLDVSYLETTGTLSIYGPNQVSVGNCSSYRVEYHDTNVSNSSDSMSTTYVNLSGPLQFYSDSNCTNPLSTFNFIPGKEVVQFYLKNTRQGSTQIRASLPNGSYGNLDITFWAGSPDHMVVMNDPGFGAAGSSVWLSVRVLDRFENPVQGVPLSFNLSSGLGSIWNSSVMTDNFGFASSLLTLGTLVTNTPSVVSVTSAVALPNLAGTGSSQLLFSEIIAPGPVSSATSTLNLTPSGTVTTGTSIQVQIRLRDQYSNPISGILPQIASSVTGTTLTQPQFATDNDGITTASFIATQIPSHDIQISFPTSLSSVGSQVTVSSFNPTAIVFNPAPSGGPYGVCRTVTIEARDYLNTVRALNTDQNFTLSTNSVSATFYTDSTCGSQGNTFTMLSGTSSYTFSYRDYIPEYLNITLTPGTGSISGLLSTSIPNTTHLSFNLPSPANAPVLSCMGPITISSPQVLSTSGATAINLSYISQLNAVSKFFSDSGCNAGSEITSTSIPANQTTSPPFYFQSDRAESENLKATSATSNNLIQDASDFFTFTPGTSVSKLIATGSSSITLNTCVPLKVSFADPGSNLFSSTSISSYTYLSFSGLSVGDVAVYSDSYCLTSLSSSAPVAPYGASTTVYLKATSLPGSLQNLSISDGTRSTTFTFSVTNTALFGNVSVGAKHTCGMFGSNFKCIGSNAFGQLGTGNTKDQLFPVSPTISGFTLQTISAGSDHTCGVSTSGDVYCWGRNDTYQSGNANGLDVLTASQISGISGTATNISAGASHSCALAGSSVLCWGDNTYGQLGDNSTTSTATARSVTGISSGATEVVAGNKFSCAVVNGGVKCWGNNTLGQLGNDRTNSYSSTPDDVYGLTSGVSALASGGTFACAIVTGSGVTNGVMCWGDNNPSSGGSNLGDGGNGANTQCSPTCRRPVYVLDSSTNNPINNVLSITAGSNHACALLSGNSVKCWGSINSNGQLGNGTTTAYPTATTISGLNGSIFNISSHSGGNTTCAAQSDGRIMCWGQNDAGQLGIGGYLTFFSNFSANPLSMVSFF